MGDLIHELGADADSVVFTEPGVYLLRHDVRITARLPSRVINRRRSRVAPYICSAPSGRHHGGNTPVIILVINYLNWFEHKRTQFLCWTLIPLGSCASSSNTHGVLSPLPIGSIFQLQYFWMVICLVRSGFHFCLRTYHCHVC